MCCRLCWFLSWIQTWFLLARVDAPLGYSSIISPWNRVCYCWSWGFWLSKTSMSASPEHSHTEMHRPYVSSLRQIKCWLTVWPLGSCCRSPKEQKCSVLFFFCGNWSIYHFECLRPDVFESLTKGGRFDRLAPIPNVEVIISPTQRFPFVFMFHADMKWGIYTPALFFFFFPVMFDMFWRLSVGLILILLFF